MENLDALEQAIERRGLQYHYLATLLTMLFPHYDATSLAELTDELAYLYPIDADEVWALLRATPAQRIEAARLCLCSQGEST
jgi:hypothetical protein